MSDERKKVEEFISTSPLYSEMVVIEHRDISHFQSFTFDFHCEVCEDIELFMLSYQMSTDGRGVPFTATNRYKGKTTQMYQGTCQHCKDYKIDMFIQFWNASVENKNADGTNTNQIKTFIQKIGQFPKFNLTPPNFISKFLDKEIGMYKQSKICYYQGYGIASFIYLRRVLEEVTKSKIQSLCQPDVTGKYNQLMKEYNESDGKKIDILLSAMNDLLPTSLNNIGGNPFTILYDKLSKAIHKFSEEECKKIAPDIFTLFEITIKKFYEDGTDSVDIKKSLSNLV